MIGVAGTDWLAIKAEYIAGTGTLKELAEQHGVCYPTLRKVAANEKWRENRTNTEHIVNKKVQDVVVQKVAKHAASRITRLLSIGDKLAAKLDEATGQLDQKIVTHKRKTKTMEYGDQPVCRNPLKETTVEEEFLAFVDAPLDRKGLQQLTTALKNLHDIAKVNEQSGNDEALQKARELLEGLPSAID